MSLDEQIDGLLKGHEWAILQKAEEGGGEGVHGVYVRAIKNLIKQQGGAL